MFTTHCSCCEADAWKTWRIYDPDGEEVEFGAFTLRSGSLTERADAYGCKMFTPVTQATPFLGAGTTRKWYPIGVVGHSQSTGCGFQRQVTITNSTNPFFPYPTYAYSTNPAVWGASIFAINKAGAMDFIGLPAVHRDATQTISTFGSSPAGQVMVSSFGPFNYNATESQLESTTFGAAYRLFAGSTSQLYAGTAYNTSTPVGISTSLRTQFANAYYQCLNVRSVNGGNTTGANRAVLGDSVGFAASYPAAHVPNGPTVAFPYEYIRTLPGPYNLDDFWDTARIVSGGGYQYVTNGMSDPTKYRNAFQGLTQYLAAHPNTIGSAGAPGTPYLGLTANSTHVFAAYVSGGTAKIERRAHASFNTVDWTYDRGSSGTIRTLAVDSSGTVYWGGVSSGGNTHGKLNSSGVSQWTGNHGATVHGITVDSTGNVYIAGNEDTTGGHYTLRKLDSSGSVVWSRSHYGEDSAGSTRGAYYDCHVSSDDERIIACGLTLLV